MTMDRATQYPHHLARRVAERLRDEGGRAPPETVLTELLETLYFASLGGGERRVFATVSYIDPAAAEGEPPARQPPARPAVARFERLLPLDLRTLRKLGRAADPAVASLAVYGDRKRGLFIWGMLDELPGRQPPHCEKASPESPAAEGPEVFRAVVTGPGNLTVYSRGTLVASLVRNTLVEQHHNVLWAGPVHALLRENLRGWLADPDDDLLEEQFVARGIDALCGILGGIHRDRRGGGVLIAPHGPRDGLSIHYLLRYDRLPTALAGLVEGQLRRHRARTAEQVAALLAELERRQSEVRRASRFIAALSGAGGVLLLERGLGVRGFGVQIRVDDPLGDVFLAGDVRGSATRLRRAELAHLGARQRALVRFCSKNPGSVGLVVSWDGDPQAVTQLEGKVVLWENVGLQPGFGAEPVGPAQPI